MTPALDQRSAARILDLADPTVRPRRLLALAAVAVFIAISAFAAHEIARGGSPTSAQAAVMSSASARIRTEESTQMKQWMARMSVASAAVAISAAAWGVGDFQPIPIARFANFRHAGIAGGGITRGDLYPTGLAEYRGVPFVHGSEEAYGWTAAPERNPKNQIGVLTISIGAQPPFRIHTLLSLWNNSSSGGPGPCSPETEILAVLRFTDGTSHTTKYTGGWDIRDHNDPLELCPPQGPEAWVVWELEGVSLELQSRNIASEAPALQSIEFLSPTPYQWAILFGMTMEHLADCNADGIVDYGQILAGELDDANSNNIPDCCEDGRSCACEAADISGNGIVDAVDLAAVLSSWGNAPTGKTNADVNRDGEINAIDLAEVLGAWGACP